MTCNTLISALIFLTLSCVVSYAVLVWWFLSDFPAVLTDALWRAGLIPKNEKWRTAEDSFYSTWTRKEWEFWMNVVVAPQSGWYGAKLVKLLTCPTCFSFHAGWASGIAVWLAAVRSWEGLMLIVLAPAAGAVALRFVQFPARRDSPSAPREPSGGKSDAAVGVKSEAWQSLGLAISDDGRVQSAVPALAMLRKFFDLSVPCFFVGCDGLREQYVAERDNLTATGCTSCDYNALETRYTHLVEKALGLDVKGNNTDVGLQSAADMADKVSAFFNASSPSPCVSADCQEYRDECLKSMAEIGDAQSAETFRTGRMSKVIRLLKP